MSQLNTKTSGSWSEQAWESYLQLSEPTSDPYRQALQTNYLGEIGQMIRLDSAWSDPKPISDCSVDLDYDGQFECLLANDHIAATFELDGARLVFAVLHTEAGTIQFSGPTSQSGVGWGDPKSWQITAGPGSDPNEVPGAFVDSDKPFQPFDVEARDGELLFSAQDGSLVKTFRLLPEGLDVQYQGALPQAVKIPLALNPSMRFRVPSWAEQYHLLPGQNTGNLTWQNKDMSVAIHGQGGTLTATTFRNSFDVIHSPENPDYAYSPGHYLPFPFALVEARPTQGEAFRVQIDLAKK